MKRFLKKIAYYVLKLPDKKVNVNVGQLNNGELLKDKNIVIIGGSSGIGLEIAKRAYLQGGNIIISSSNENKLKNVISSIGESAIYIAYDITNINKCATFLNKCEEKFNGKIDILICSNGISLHEGSFKNVTEEGFDKQFNTNLKGTYFLSCEFLKRKERDNEGNLIIISSETADQCYDIPYGMTKAAINSMICAFSRREYQNGIRVNGIAPGVVETEMTKEYAMIINGDYSRSNAMGRVLIPEEIAETAIFLMSDLSKCVSGEIIHCNGGNHLKAFWDITN